MDVEDNKNRRLIFITMNGILTPEEKKYLRRTCNYLGSLGMQQGVVGFELDRYQSDLTQEDIKWDNVTHFENNYRAEILDDLIPILKKIMDYVIKSGKFDDVDSVDFDYINYQKIDIEIDCTYKDISVNYYYYFTDRGDETSIEFDSADDIERFDRWMENDLRDIEVPDDGLLILDYSGGGDSGYLESSFNETGDGVPAGIEDWCYRALEVHFGGWEINEGSDGKFIFNFNDSTVLLLHTMNIDASQSHTLFEEKFGV
jgi:hypothetical protein